MEAPRTWRTSVQSRTGSPQTPNASRVGDRTTYPRSDHPPVVRWLSTVGSDNGAGGGRSPDRRFRSYLNQIHLELVVVLVIICAVFTAFGWSWRPQSSGFPTVPENLSITMITGGPPTIDETMTRTADNGSTLQLVDGAFGSGLTEPNNSTAWTLRILNLGAATVCTPRENVIDGGSRGIAVARQHVKVVEVGSTTPGVSGLRTQVQSSGFYDVVLCWKKNGPVNLNGSYLSAQFPPLYNDNGSISMSRSLTARGGDTANYTIQSAPTPSGSDAQSWNWNVSASDSIRLSAVNSSDTQHDSYRGFLSGVALGLAGGALITLIQELVTPLSRRRDSKYAG